MISCGSVLKDAVERSGLTGLIFRAINPSDESRCSEMGPWLSRALVDRSAREEEAGCEVER
jgi:hypothetical protein